MLLLLFRVTRIASPFLWRVSLFPEKYIVLIWPESGHLVSLIPIIFIFSLCISCVTLCIFPGSYMLVVFRVPIICILSFLFGSITSLSHLRRMKRNFFRISCMNNLDRVAWCGFQDFCYGSQQSGFSGSRSATIIQLPLYLEAQVCRSFFIITQETKEHWLFYLVNVWLEIEKNVSTGFILRLSSAEAIRTRRPANPIRSQLKFELRLGHVKWKPRSANWVKNPACFCACLEISLIRKTGRCCPKAWRFILKVKLKVRGFNLYFSLQEKHHEDVYYQSYFNQSPSVHLNEIGADPYPYLGLPVLFGDGFKTPSLSEDFGLVGLDSLGVMKDNDLVNNFNPYEPAEVPLKYPLPESTPTTLNEFQVQRESGQEVNLALPLKKRKPTEEEELNIIVAAKNMEDLEQSQKLQKAYPAERQMSIADVQRVCTKIRTLAARKEYPTSEQVYQKPVQPPLAEEQNVNYQKYPDQCPDQRGNIRNFFINVHSSHSAKPFWVMLGPIDSEGQCTAPQEAPVEQNSAAQANMPVLPPVKAKRGRKPSTVIKPPGVKRGRGRPRKNPPILTKTTN